MGKFMVRWNRVVAVALLCALGWLTHADEGVLKQPGRWAQDYVHREADPVIVFGTLPNGLRYAIRHNETPKDGVAMRLRIGSGSLQESDEEQGLAHFLEHMAFRGSAHVPDGDVVRMLERQGLKFGPDTNAFTSHEQTVYMFNFPKADASALDTGLTLFREIGENLLLDQKLIETERGVVLSEERLRDSPAYKAIKANYANLLAGTSIPNRWPIGTVETIKAANHDRLEKFYRQNYRPDNATIIIVGNVDPKAVEQDIIKRFGDWHSAVAVTPKPVEVPKPVKPVVEFIAPGAPDELSLDYIRPVDLRAETDEVDRERVKVMMAQSVLNLRLADRAAKPRCPYLSAAVSIEDDILGVAALTSLSLMADPKQLPEALNAVVEEQRRLVTDGITQAELDRVLTIFRTSLEAEVASAGTRHNVGLADGILKDVNDDALTISPQQDKAWFDREFNQVRLDDINHAAAQLFNGSGPVMFRSAQSDPLTTEKLNAILQTAYSRNLTQAAATQKLQWPYTRFGSTGKAVGRVEDQALGTVTTTFANGVKLIVKKTDFEKDHVRVAVNFGNGLQVLGDSVLHSVWATGFIPLGGTRLMSAGDIGRYTQENGLLVSNALTVSTHYTTLSGITRPKDLNFQLQLLAAYFSDAGFRPEMAEKLGAQIPMIEGQIETSAGAVFARAVEELTAGGNRRFLRYPSQEDLKGTRVDELKAIYESLHAGPLTVVVVGDVTESAVVNAVAQTFAALKPVKGQALNQAAITNFDPKATPAVSVVHQGRADQAFIGVFWPLPDHVTAPEILQPLPIATNVLSQRLVDSVREKLGITYSPSASARSAFYVKNMGYFQSSIETPAENFERFKALLNEQITALAETPVSDDELERARRPIVESRIKNRENNGYWLEQLGLLDRDPMVKDFILKDVDAARAVTAEQVQQLYARYLNNKPALVLTTTHAQPH